MYVELNPVNDKDELSKLKIEKIDWDVVVHNTPYQIVRIVDRPHGEGGKYGINEYYAYPLNEEMSIENLAGFWGRPINWGISFEENNSSKTKWNHTSINSTGKCIITRNGEPFYHIPCRDMSYGLAKAQFLIVEFDEHPIGFIDRNWEKNLIGRKVWYKESPAIVKRVNEGEVFIVPDGIKEFPIPNSWKKDSIENPDIWNDYKDGLNVEFLSPNVVWFR